MVSTIWKQHELFVVDVYSTRWYTINSTLSTFLIYYTDYQYGMFLYTIALPQEGVVPFNFLGHIQMYFSNSLRFGVAFSNNILLFGACIHLVNFTMLSFISLYFLASSSRLKLSIIGDWFLLNIKRVTLTLKY